jgi:predicted DsbA family dithiol-disulfide isomerase
MEKGGYPAFAKHVREAAALYLEEPIHEDIWNVVRPTTSANAHLVLHAVRVCRDGQVATRLANRFRAAFFQEAQDISQLPVLYEIAQEHKIETSEIREAIQNGSAVAGLMSDMRLGHEKHIAGSPTWILNEGRQILYGNVGYRVLQANVEELVKRPGHEASWC